MSDQKQNNYPLTGDPVVGSSDLLAVADPFIRVLAIMDAPPGHPPAGDSPLREYLPGLWPSVGDLRTLIKAITANVPAQRPPAKDA